MGSLSVLSSCFSSAVGSCSMRLFAALFVLVSEGFVASPLTPALGAGLVSCTGLVRLQSVSEQSGGGTKPIGDAGR